MTTVTNSSDTWRTRDLPLAAYLHTKGYPFKRMEIVSTSESVRAAVYWHFEDCDDLHDEIDIFLQGDAQVEPSAYNNSLSYLKREMYQFMAR